MKSYCPIKPETVSDGAKDVSFSQKLWEKKHPSHCPTPIFFFTVESFLRRNSVQTLFSVRIKWLLGSHVICRTTVTKFTGWVTEMFTFQLNVYTVAISSATFNCYNRMVTIKHTRVSDGIVPHAVGKEIDSLLAKYVVWHNPLLIGMQWTCGIRHGVNGVAGDGVSGEQRSGTATGGVGWGTPTWKRGAVFVIGSMLPGMLLRVRLECILFVDFRMRLAVGFGAAMLGGGVGYLGEGRDIVEGKIGHPLFHPLFQCACHPLFWRGDIWCASQISGWMDPLVDRVFKALFGVLNVARQ